MLNEISEKKSSLRIKFFWHILEIVIASILILGGIGFLIFVVIDKLL